MAGAPPDHSPGAAMTSRAQRGNRQRPDQQLTRSSEAARLRGPDGAAGRRVRVRVNGPPLKFGRLAEGPDRLAARFPPIQLRLFVTCVPASKVVSIASTVPGSRPAKRCRPAVRTCILARPRRSRPPLSPPRSSMCRLCGSPQVHDTTRHGLISPAIEIYRERGACAYLGEALIAGAAYVLTSRAKLQAIADERRASSARDRIRGRGKA